jgi:hypothetical protein
MYPCHILSDPVGPGWTNSLLKAALNVTNEAIAGIKKTAGQVAGGNKLIQRGLE